MTLYELTDQYMQLLSMAEDEDVDPDVLNDTLEGLDGEIEDKADGYAKVIRSLEGDVESIQKEIDRLEKKKRAVTRNIDTMKKSLESAMQATGMTKFKTELFSFNIQRNPAKVAVLDVKSIPSEFWKPQNPTLDKKAVATYLKENGNQNWAILMQSESLRIK